MVGEIRPQLGIGASSEMNSIFCRKRRRMTVSSWSSPIAIASR
jgi:hypothetical protein